MHRRRRRRPCRRSPAACPAACAASTSLIWLEAPPPRSAKMRRAASPGPTSADPLVPQVGAAHSSRSAGWSDACPHPVLVTSVGQVVAKDLPSSRRSRRPRTLDPGGRPATHTAELAPIRPAPSAGRCCPGPGGASPAADSSTVAARGLPCDDDAPVEPGRPTGTRVGVHQGQPGSAARPAAMPEAPADTEQGATGELHGTRPFGRDDLRLPLSGQDTGRVAGQPAARGARPEQRLDHSTVSDEQGPPEVLRALFRLFPSKRGLRQG